MANDEEDEEYAWMLNFKECESDVTKFTNPTSSGKIAITPPTTKSTKEATTTKLLERYDDMLTQQKINQEILRKLRIVRLHKEKNKMETLEHLIAKWRTACQTALTQLLDYAPKEPPTSMGQLITYLGIDPNLVQYSKANLSFKKVKRTV